MPKTAETAIEYHDAIAAEFAARYQQSADFRERYHIWTALLDRYLRAGDRVLDAGCGTGVFSLYAARHGAVVTAIDGSETMIALTRRAAEQAGLTLQTEVAQLPLTAERSTFDVVLSSSVLEYVPDLTATIQSLGRQVRPGGLLIVSLPNRRSLYRRLERASYRLTGKPVYLRHVRQYATPTLLHRLLGETRFDLIAHQTYGGTNAVARLLRTCLPAAFADTLFVAVFRRQILTNDYFQ